MAVPTKSPNKMQFRTIDGLLMRFAESEPREEHALLLSPWPESLLAFEQMWSRLAEHAHLVAVDLPGFGHSKRRDELLSSRAMAEFIIHIADAFAAASHPDSRRDWFDSENSKNYPTYSGH